MPSLTIGLATFNDFDGVFFTLQALRLYHDLADSELLVVDNFGCSETRRLVEGMPGVRYVAATGVVGSAAAKDVVFREATGDLVLCCDCHVLLAPGAVARLRAHHREHPRSRDLLQGPLLYDDARSIATHMEPRWHDQSWGRWATDPRGVDPDAAPFEIPMQGLGVFACRRDAWPGFHPAFRGYGGEEGYLHEKFRRAGARCLCLPWLRWMHRFGRPAGAPYPLRMQDKLRNYAIGFAELGLDLRPLARHFAESAPMPSVVAVMEEALGITWLAG